MTTGTDRLDPDVLADLGLCWYPSGQAALRGPLLALAEALDRDIVRRAQAWAPQPERHPAWIAATELERVDYFRSFPHVATFAVGLDADPDNIDAFLEGPMLEPDGAMALTKTAPVRDVLTPAACYHIYVAHQGEALVGPMVVTTRNTCFRREVEYLPLQRQANFTMREIVTVGSTEAVATFLAEARIIASAMFVDLGIEIAWEHATDPFFRPAQNPKFLWQTIAPVKFEMVFDGRLAVGSTNLHHEHFGHSFDLTCAGETATSGCLAFGIERLVHAVLSVHGPDPRHWPLALEEAGI